MAIKYTNLTTVLEATQHLHYTDFQKMKKLLQVAASLVPPALLQGEKCRTVLVV